MIQTGDSELRTAWHRCRCSSFVDESKVQLRGAGTGESQLSLERPSPHVLLARDQRTTRICRQRPVTRSNQGDRHECRDDAQERYEHSNGHNASRHWRALRERSRRLEPSRSEEHTSELQSLMRNSYAVFCLNKK